MSTDNTKKVVRELVDAHVRHDVPRVKEILSPRLIWHGGGAAQTMGRDDYVTGLEMGAKAFSDQKIELGPLVAEGDEVAAVMTITMRHTGEFQGIAPTGRTITFASMWFYRIVEARVVEAWQLDEDLLAKLRAET